MNSIAIVDYGASNLRSVFKALDYVSIAKEKVFVSDQPDEILKADRVVFPGQGAIGQCMRRLQQKDLVDVLQECIKTKPFLGICLGLQSLMQDSDEDGGTTCLGIIPGKVVKFPDNTRDSNDNRLKIPHMGWNRVKQQRQHPLWKEIESGTRFYFVHSFYVKPESDEDIAGSTDYINDFTSAIAHDNLFAVQFHPEKSQRAGLTLLRNFLNWDLQ